MKSSHSTLECTVSASSPVLTRALLRSGAASTLAQADSPDESLLGDTDRKTSLEAFLASRPPGDLWVFGYGSLMWNPALKSIDCRIASVKDWHRTFCLSMIAGRGTADQPGLALGLDRGGKCTGIAFRIAEQDIFCELELLWEREMLLGGYQPQWLDIFGSDGHKFGSALTFVIDRQHSNCAGELTMEERVHRLSTAAGSWGSSADYISGHAMRCAARIFSTLNWKGLLTW